MHSDNIDYIKKLIQEEGGCVSCVDPMGPVTVLFFTVWTQMTDLENNPIGPYPNYERVVLEHGVWSLDNADELRPHIRDIVKASTGMDPVFSVYNVSRNEDNKLKIRAGFINHIWGGKTVKETTYEEAIDLVKNPPDHPHFIHWVDMKTVYKL